MNICVLFASVSEHRTTRGRRSWITLLFCAGGTSTPPLKAAPHLCAFPRTPLRFHAAPHALAAARLLQLFAAGAFYAPRGTFYAYLLPRAPAIGIDGGAGWRGVVARVLSAGVRTVFACSIRRRGGRILRAYSVRSACWCDSRGERAVERRRFMDGWDFLSHVASWLGGW